jgi:membrane associated rhomboid family serine protease
MVMPLWDDNPLTLPKLPVATWGLIIANVVVFIVESVASPQLQSTLLTYALIPAALTNTAGVPPGVSPYVTLVTYQFLHADVLHILGNMLFLWIFGDDIEEAMGPLRFILFYLGCGIAAGLAFTASAPHAATPLIGASGAIAGVLSAYLMLKPCHKVLVFIPWFILWIIFRPVVRLAAYWVLGAWILTQFWSISVQTTDQVAYMAHVGGLVAGAVLFPLLRYRTVKLFECIRETTAPPPAKQVS